MRHGKINCVAISERDTASHFTTRCQDNRQNNTQWSEIGSEL